MKEPDKFKNWNHYSMINIWPKFEHLKPLIKGQALSGNFFLLYKLNAVKRGWVWLDK